MKKIMFNDRFGLTEAVLNGSKTQTRRVCKIQQPDGWLIAFPASAIVSGYSDPLFGSYRFFNPNNISEFTEWIKPSYKVGEVVAVAQSYEDVFYKEHRALPVDEPVMIGDGFNNKMFVKAELMPHQIRITGVRIERLQDISEDDCLKEGIYKG